MIVAKPHEIVPSKGVPPIVFGMAPQIVEGLLGPAERSRTNADGEREEHRASLLVRYDSESETVVEFSFGPDSDVVLDGVAILQSPDPAEELLRRSTRVVECLGFLVFLDLGVALSGYHDGDSDQRALTVFVPGRWDSLAKHFAEYTK